MPTSSPSSPPLQEQRGAPAHIDIGDRVKLSFDPETKRNLTTTGLVGTVCFLGPTFFAEGPWAGLALDVASGKHNGTIKGIKYFECEPNHGMFVRPDGLQKLVSADQRGRGPTPMSSAQEPQLQPLRHNASPPNGYHTPRQMVDPQQQQQQQQRSSSAFNASAATWALPPEEPVARAPVSSFQQTAQPNLELQNELRLVTQQRNDHQDRCAELEGHLKALFDRQTLRAARKKLWKRTTDPSLLRGSAAMNGSQVFNGNGICNGKPDHTQEMLGALEARFASLESRIQQQGNPAFEPRLADMATIASTLSNIEARLARIESYNLGRGSST